MKKSELGKSAFLLLLMLLSIVCMTFAWFNARIFSGKEVLYTKRIILPSSNVAIQNFIGEYDEKGNLYYTPVDPPFDCTTLEPGGRQLFKTEIYNYYATESTSSVYLLGLQYSSELYGFLTIQTTMPVDNIAELSERASEGIHAGTAGQPDEAVYNLDKALIAPQVTIKGTTDPENPSVTEVYWAVDVDSAAENDCIGKWLYINGMQLLAE